MLKVSEGSVRYNLRRKAQGASDGRASQARRAEAYREAIDAYLAALSERAPSNVAELHAYLVREHDNPGSLRSVQRYVRATFPPPKIRARRRVETPPGAQAQAPNAFRRAGVKQTKPDRITLRSVRRLFGVDPSTPPDYRDLAHTTLTRLFPRREEFLTSILPDAFDEMANIRNGWAHGASSIDEPAYVSVRDLVLRKPALLPAIAGLSRTIA